MIEPFFISLEGTMVTPDSPVSEVKLDTSRITTHDFRWLPLYCEFTSTLRDTNKGSAIRKSPRRLPHSSRLSFDEPIQGVAVWTGCDPRFSVDVQYVPRRSDLLR